MAEYLGEIRLFAGDVAPRSWALCEGQIVPKSSYIDLFALIGTRYGGDGTTTMGLPDLRGRAPIGAGHGPGLSDRPLGGPGGEETHALTLSEMPSHNHQATATVKQPVNTEEANTEEPQNAVAAVSGSSLYNTDSTPDAYANEAEATVNINLNGAGRSHSNMQPYIAISYIICTDGIWPGPG